VNWRWRSACGGRPARTVRGVDGEVRGVSDRRVGSRVGVSAGSRLLELRVDPERVVPVLLGVVAVLSLLSLSGPALHLALDFDLPWVGAWSRLTSAEGAGSIMSGAQSLMLLLAGGVLWTVADDVRERAERWAGQWYGLALGAVLLAVDEFVELHERVLGPAYRALAGTWAADLAWTAVAILAVASVGVGYRRFLRALPRGTARGIMLGAGVYLGGEVFLNVVGSRLEYVFGEGSVILTLASVIGADLEMLGVTTLVAVVARHGPRPAW
jgi:hypothetical protein